jgi:hypothetical protein
MVVIPLMNRIRVSKTLVDAILAAIQLIKHRNERFSRDEHMYNSVMSPS